MRQVNSRCEDVERDHVELLGKRAFEHFTFVFLVAFIVFEEVTKLTLLILYILR